MATVFDLFRRAKPTTSRYWHTPPRPHHSPRSIARTYRAACRAFQLFRALAFGNYAYSTGGPEPLDDGHVYIHDGALHKWTDPCPLSDPRKLMTSIAHEDDEGPTVRAARDAIQRATPLIEEGFDPPVFKQGRFARA